MRVLIVSSGNANNISPFIIDQANALKKKGIEIDFFIIVGKGSFGYLKNYNKFLYKLASFKPDIVHAHYGLSGLFANLQRKIPVITTFHGCDINVPRNRFLSKIADKLSSESIFISHILASRLKKKMPNIIPCGVDLDIFYPINKEHARKKMGFSKNRKYILFSSSFLNPVKNYPLAKEAVSKVAEFEIELLELKGFSREEVALLINAVDLVLLTSIREGSPQIIKEAMSCNTPIISLDVGDVKDIIYKTKGCCLVGSNPYDISKKIEDILVKNEKTTGRNDILHLNNSVIAEKIISIYNLVSSK